MVWCDLAKDCVDAISIVNDETGICDFRCGPIQQSRPDQVGE